MTAKPYALAGFWERWKDCKAGTELLAFTVITTDKSEVVEQLHDRMPCRLKRQPKRQLHLTRAVCVIEIGRAHV